MLGLTVVLPTGEIVKTGKSTVKGVTGYDLTALMCGSEGTLGIVTEITLRLLPKPQAIATAFLAFASHHNAALAVAAIFTAGILPRSLEYMDQTSLKAVSAAGAPLKVPEDAVAGLILETDGDDSDSVMSSLVRAVEVAQKKGAFFVAVATDEKKRRAIWDTRRMTSESLRRLRKFRVSEDIVVPRSKIPQMVKTIEELGQKYQLFTCAFGHAGDGNLHAQVLFDEDNDRPHVEKLLEELFVTTVAMGGTLTGEHGIGLAKQRFLALEQSKELIELQRRIKSAFDPLNLLNPGKFLPV